MTHSYLIGKPRMLYTIDEQWTERRSGKQQLRTTSDHRSPFERDGTRVIHCPAFRRLQRKTQILGTDEGDFHRTRLTHSLEVASIARSIARNLRRREQALNYLPDDDLITAISLLHDIGHPPFGHGGEVALHYMMSYHGGFEGNGQTLRLLTKIEDSYGAFGLDLTRRTLLGVLKYPVAQSAVHALKHKPKTSKHGQIKINDWLPPKAYLDCEQPEVDWLLAPLSAEDKENFTSLTKKPTNNEHGKSRYKSLDCSIMDIADDIAYGVHDLEDAIYLKLIDRDELDTEEFHQLYLEAGIPDTMPDSAKLLDMLFHRDITERKQAIGALVNFFITSSLLTNHTEFAEPLLQLNVTLPKGAKQLLNYLQQAIFTFVIDSHEARTIEYGGQTVVQRLFEAISSNPESLLNIDNRKRYIEAEDNGLRVISDLIANMTDEYAYRMHERLFGFNTRTVFERL